MSEVAPVRLAQGPKAEEGITQSCVYPVGNVNTGVELVAEVMERAGLLLLLGPQKKIIDPELPGVTMLELATNVVQFPTSVVGGIAGKVCVKRVVRAYALPTMDIIRSASGGKYFLPIFILFVHLLRQLRLILGCCGAKPQIGIQTFLQLSKNHLTHGIAGNVCVNSVVAAWTVPAIDRISRAKGGTYFLPILMLLISVSVEYLLLWSIHGWIAIDSERVSSHGPVLSSSDSKQG